MDIIRACNSKSQIFKIHINQKIYTEFKGIREKPFPIQRGSNKQIPKDWGQNYYDEKKEKKKHSSLSKNQYIYFTLPF